MRTLAVFSSDGREQYKSDIYKVLSLPEGDVVHFRYKKKYIDDSILYKNSVNMLEDEKVTIFFSQGNEIDHPKPLTELNNISVREAVILSFEWSPVTELFHVRFKLSGFSNVIPCGELASDKFFQEIEIEKKASGHDWKSRVESVKNYFPGFIFFHIEGLYNSKGQLVKSTYNTQSHSRVYHVNHGQRYTLKVYLGNPCNVSANLRLDYNPDDVVIAYCNPIQSSVEYDDIFIPLNIRLASVFKHSNFIFFEVNKSLGKSCKENRNLQPHDDVAQPFDIYKISQELSIKMNLSRAAVFGFLSLLAFTGATLASLKEGLDILPSSKYLLSGAFVFFSTGGLFYYFNKK